MLALSDNRIVIVMDAAADLAPEKRATFLERLAGHLGVAASHMVRQEQDEASS